MINKTVNKQPKGLVEVEVSANWSDVSSIWDQTLTRLITDLELPGFRKGTVPQAMAEQNLGSKLQEEALKMAMPQLLASALQGTDIVPIDFPKYQLTSFAKGSDLKFKASITNRPTVAIGDYKKIKVAKTAAKFVPETEIDKVIEDLFKRYSTRVPVAPANSNQTSIPNASGTAGSIDFGGGSASNIPAAPVAIIPDDTFAKAMGANSLVELKDKIKKDLQDHANLNSEMDHEEHILQEVEKITTVDLPEILIEDELNRMLVSLQRRVADMGLLLEDYLKGQNKTIEQIRTEWKVQAEKNVRMELGLAEIARQENVVISDADMQAEVDKIQDAKVKQQFEAAEPRLHLKHALRQTKTLDLLKKMVSN